MAITVEDGSGVAGAESYISVAGADTYHANRGNAAWAALTTTAKEQALRKATDYMTGVYRNAWAGFRNEALQALDWPRSYVPIADSVSAAYLANDTVPDAVKFACAELAARASAADLAPDETRGILREKTGPLETEYDPYSPAAPRYPAIDRMLSAYLTQQSGVNVSLVRS